MRTAVVALLLLLAATGCASWPFNRAATGMLTRADRLARAGDYPAAVAVYDDFLARHPDDRAAPRALETRDALASILTARRELVRLREEVTRLRDDLARREADLAEVRQELITGQAELARVRQELATRQAEAERFRADLERLKQIDMRLEKRRR